MSKIRQFNGNTLGSANNQSNNYTGEAKLHVAKLHVMPSITLTSPEMKSVSIGSDISDSSDSSVNWKDYYGDDEEGLNW